MTNIAALTYAIAVQDGKWEPIKAKTLTAAKGTASRRFQITFDSKIYVGFKAAADNHTFIRVAVKKGFEDWQDIFSPAKLGES